MALYAIPEGLKTVENSTILEEANQIASLLPALMRQLFTLDDELAVDLPLAQLRVCASLQAGPLPMSTLSRELGVTLSAMTQIADRLERTKLVSRVAQQSDRRVRCLQLTPRGEKMMKHRDDTRIRNVLTVFNYMSPNARKEILTALETMMKASVTAKTEKASNGESVASRTEKSSNGKSIAASHHKQQELLLSKVIS
jgi:DNA-binding MarR family transcriptional regulator